MLILLPTLALANLTPERLLGDEPRFEPARSYAASSRIGAAARPVGLLVVERDRTSRCTATLIADDLLLTNAHCVDGSVARIRFHPDFEDDTSRGEAVPVEVVPVEQDDDLDYALLRVPVATGARHGVAVLDPTRPRRGEDVLLVHHPRSRPKMVTRYGCRIEGRSRDTLRHLCDTEPGSSGAPVYSGDGTAMVALHRGSSDDGAHNVATPVASLVAHSPILAELIGAPSPVFSRPFQVLNRCGEPLRVALRTLDPVTERWTTLDFQRIDAGEALSVKANDNRWAYYTAQSLDGTLYWEAPPGEANRNLKPIGNAWYGLRRTDVSKGSLELTCTVNATPRWLVRNRCNVPVDLTLRTKSRRGWVTTRWDRLAPGATVSKRTKNRVGYYHAGGDGVRWTGDANHVRVDGKRLGMRRKAWDAAVYATDLTCDG